MSETTAYDAAIAAASTDAERERLHALRFQFTIPPDSPEWQFYAVLAPLLRTEKPTAPLVVQPAAAGALYAIVLALVAMLAAASAWAVATTTEDARFRANAPSITTLLATRGGRAALQLVNANGDGLADALTRCKRFDTAGHGAGVCTLWLSPALGHTLPAPAEHLADVALHVPAWPLLILVGIIATVRALIARPQKKKGADGW